MASTSSELGGRILSQVPPDRAFYFYIDLGKPLGVRAASLGEFAEKVGSVEVKSLEFHLQRGDFDKWVYMLGDAELTKKLIKLRNERPAGEKLRRNLTRILRTRLTQLQKPASNR
jgi:hypothetical protein